MRTVAVVGSGTMGSGIAQVCAQTGWKTRLYDAFPDSLEKGMNSIGEFWKGGITRGKNTEEQVNEWSSKLIACENLEEALSGVDLVIEAVPEKIDLKRSIFQKIEELAPENAILATNTSGLRISEIASAVKNPERVIGMHFFNPVPVMKLLEVIKHDLSSDGTINQVIEIGNEMGKTSIVVRDVPGFATSRLGVVLGNEAIRMLAEGVASANDIDTAMKLGYRHPMGPLELSDLVGLDVRRDILNNLADSFDDPSYLPHPLLVRLVESGELGKKTGRGIYNWSKDGKSEREDL
ncbi:MAG TPA: 3-hydroxyacyl-CoA dehydrogenase family protein [Candidatus Poseidoniales archaeon]|nr:MAG TPA: 3-hydroxyacyl-CoA dehydrogenase family protein [Candidatus Poseidoniales archaeon]|tara:strand:+ start:1123 stop:2001 length:879 start_codon:yes stop_codon:yes gene_type:complete